MSKFSSGWSKVLIFLTHISIRYTHQVIKTRFYFKGSDHRQKEFRLKKKQPIFETEFQSKLLRRFSRKWMENRLWFFLVSVFVKKWHAHFYLSKSLDCFTEVFWTWVVLLNVIISVAPMTTKLLSLFATMCIPAYVEEYEDKSNLNGFCIQFIFAFHPLIVW